MLSRAKTQKDFILRSQQALEEAQHLQSAPCDHAPQTPGGVRLSQLVEMPARWGRAGRPSLIAQQSTAGAPMACSRTGDRNLAP